MTALVAAEVMPEEREDQPADVPARVREYVLTVPETWRRVLTRSLTGQATPSEERRAHCGACCHWDRQAIKECGVWRCAHHAKRPFRAKG